MPLKLLKIVNPSLRYRARFFLSYFLNSLWNRMLPTSLHTSAPSKTPIATSNNPQSFFILVFPLLNKRDFRACFIIAFSLVGIAMYSSANFFPTDCFWLKDQIFRYRIGQICYRGFLSILTKILVYNFFCVVPFIQMIPCPMLDWH